MTIKRIIRDRRLTDEEAAKYRKIRAEIAAELPELIARHHERMAATEKVDDKLKNLQVSPVPKSPGNG